MNTIGIGSASALALLLGACSAGSGMGEWAGAVRDSAGVVIVENPDHGMWPEGGGWSVAEELRIGTFGGDLDQQFGQVGTVAVNSVGEIFVSDTQAQDVRVFSPEGTYLRTLGGPGSGPGELGPGASVFLISLGDTLLVPDPRNRRINRYAPDGTLLGSASLNPERERVLRYNLNPLGAMAVQVRPVRFPNQPVIDTMDAIRIVETSGAFGDTLFRFPSGGLFQGPGIHYFTSEPMWEITDSLTLLYGVNSEYRIGVYGRDGALRRVISRAFVPTRISDRDIQALFSFLDQAWLDAGVPPSRIEENHGLVHFADFFPAYFFFQEGYQGTLWVQPVRPPGDLSEEDMARYNFTEDFGASGWEVFDREGRFLGVVEMPPRFQPRIFVENKIYGVLRDELDVQYVLRLSIVEGLGP